MKVGDRRRSGEIPRDVIVGSRGDRKNRAYHKRADLRGRYVGAPLVGVLAGKFTRGCRISYLLVFVLLLSSVAGLVFSVLGYQAYSASYQRSMGLAQQGMQHLRKAEALFGSLPQRPFDAQIVQKARQEFTAASKAFVQLNDDLKSLPGISTLIPVYGTRLSAALRLVPLAIGISQAGVAGCNILDLLIARFHDPLGGKGQALTMADFAVINQNFRQVKSGFNLAIEQANQLEPGDLQFDPRLAQLFTSFRKNVPMLQDWLSSAENFLSVAPALLGVGKPANYLIEILDSTELRPAGGFIGNYGIATLSGGRLTAARITDVDLLDRPFKMAGNRIPYPPAYAWFGKYLAPDSWSLRDSNLDADFPTVARNAELNYAREGGNVPVQGVIAITPALIQRALEITGPIAVPEYQETVTPQNLIDRIHYYQLSGLGGPDYIPSPDGYSSLRKRFTALLADHFLESVRRLSPSALPRFFQLLLQSVRSKDIQIYFNSSTAEGVLQHYRLDAAIQAPIGDSLFVVDANVAGNKANAFIVNTLDDRVTLDGQGNAIHRTTITYAWTIKGQFYGRPRYQDYVRVYVPPGSVLQTQDGWQPLGTNQAFGRKVWIGYFSLYYGQTRVVTLVWTVPRVANHDAQGWHYQYLIQRQAGAQWRLHLQVTPPSCAVPIGAQGGLVVKGKQVTPLTQPLDQDMNLGVNYNC